MDKRTWLWDASLLSFYDEAVDVVKFAKQAGVKVIYTFLSNRIGDDDYRQFIYLASQAGIEVHAAIGEAAWYHPDRLPEIYAKLDRIAAYNRASEHNEVFTGVHFDIEPHQLDVWKNAETRPQAIEDWNETCIAYHAYARNLFDIELSVAVPIALNNQTDADIGVLRRNMLKHHDKVVVMAYRNFATGDDSIAFHTAAFMISANAVGRDDSVIVAVETKPIEPTKLSFATLGKGIMNDVLYDVQNFYWQQPAFAGVAIHSLEYWRELPYTV